MEREGDGKGGRKRDRHKIGGDEGADGDGAMALRAEVHGLQPKEKHLASKLEMHRSVVRVCANRSSGAVVEV